jgi:hypothetical protein
MGVEVAMGLTPPLAEMSGVKEAPRAPSPQNDLCGVAGGPCIVGGKRAAAAAGREQVPLAPGGGDRSRSQSVRRAECHT